MDDDAVVLLIACAVVSFALGRTGMYLRKKMREKKSAAARKAFMEQRVRASHCTPLVPMAHNKGKRKRQLATQNDQSKHRR